MPQFNTSSLYMGITSSPIREFVAQTLVDQKPERFVMPTCGRFAVVECMIGMGADKSKIHASDIQVFSSILGYLADPTKNFDDLGLKPNPALPPIPTTDYGPQVDLGAQVMMNLAVNNRPPNNERQLRERRQLLNFWPDEHKKMAEQIVALVDNIRGIHYEIADVYDVLYNQLRDGDACYFSLPGYAGGFERQFNASGLQWNAPPFEQTSQDSQFQPHFDKFQKIFADLKGHPARVLAYNHSGVNFEPEGWQRVSATNLGTGSRPYIFILANWDWKNRQANQKFAKGEFRKFPVYCDEDITADSKINIVQVDLETCLHYRDLFVHKLGTTKAERYFLMLVDGRVTTAFGLHMQNLFLRKDKYIYEVFGISKSSKKYSRLGKLFMLALTSGSTKQYLESVLDLQFFDPRGIQTSSITTHHEGKTDRNVMKLVHREKLKDGRFRLIYRTDFRTDTWAQVMAQWHARWGQIKRHKEEAVSHGATAN